MPHFINQPGMKNILLTCFALLLLSCSGNEQSKNPTPVKIASVDPFANTIIASEYFKKDVTDHCFLESKNGSFFYIPEGAFLDHRGKPVKGIVKNNWHF
jgi:hypothetical protein